MTYQDCRRHARTVIKARLLTTLQEAERTGRDVTLVDVAVELQCSLYLMRLLWRQLADEGLVSVSPEGARARRETVREKVPDLAKRIALVREAKHEKWERTGRKRLTEAELEEVLP